MRLLIAPCCAALLVLNLLLETSLAQSILLDDFEDGIDELWSLGDVTLEIPLPNGVTIPPLPWGPGVFETSNGELNMRTTSPVPPDTMLPFGDPAVAGRSFSPLSLGWTPSEVDPSFSNGRLRARVRANSPSNPGLVFRADPAAFSFYVFYGAGSFGEFHFQRSENGAVTRFEALPGVTFTPGDDWMMEAGAIGDELSLKVWKVGEPEPSQPQLLFHDDLFATGVMGISASISANNLVNPTPVDVTFDYVSFTAVPEPSSIGMTALLLAPLFIFARKHRARR